MPATFDPGICQEPFVTLCDEAPDPSIFPSSSFRVEWGPIFHRGRLDGTRADIVHRPGSRTKRDYCPANPDRRGRPSSPGLPGKARHRPQLCDAQRVTLQRYNQSSAKKHVNDPVIVAYRNRWLSALTTSGSLEAVVAFGSLADAAWQEFAMSSERAAAIPYQHIPHPTSPELGGAAPERIKKATAAMLRKWNAALEALRQAVQHPDAVRPFVPYGVAFQPSELVEIPSFDMPAGIPDMDARHRWMGRPHRHNDS